MKKTTLLIAVILLAAASCARPEVTSICYEADGIECQITAYSPEIIRVTKRPAGTACTGASCPAGTDDAANHNTKRPVGTDAAGNEALRPASTSADVSAAVSAGANGFGSGAVASVGRESFSVVMQPQPVKAVVAQTDSTISISTGVIRATLSKATGEVAFTDAVSGAPLLKETGTTFTPRPAPDQSAGQATTASAPQPAPGKFRVSQSWQLDEGEFICGLGQRQDPDLSLRGKTVHLWNENKYIYIPFFCSAKGWGLYWDNPGMSDFTDGPEGSVMSSEVASCTDLYFLYGGGSLDRVIATERALGGKATMFPLWVHGYWQCRERYHSTAELCEALRTHREMGIPLDAIVQDWQYWGPNTNWNSMRFDNPAYERADTMIAYVHAQHAHLPISIWPDFGPDTPQYQELDAAGLLFPFKTWPLEGGVKIYDPFSPVARGIYWKYLKGLVDSGVDALWSDSTEPDHFWPTEEEFDHPTAAGSWRAVKNAFPLVTNEGIYTNYRAAGYTKRAVQMTRSAAFGIQRYGTFSWSGDVDATWEVLKAQIPSGLNYTVCGIPYWNTDIGGFFNWWYEGGTANPELQELQVRWMQWSVFVPVMRNHTSGPLTTEIYRFGEPGSWAFDEQLRAVKLRYSLLPYIYSLAGATVQDDATIMRPLVMDFPSDPEALAVSDAYMFGPALLVHPVTDPVLTGSHGPSFSTYLPAGALWYDFHTGQALEAGWYSRDYGISEIPVFARAGSIIPLGPDVQYSSEKPWDELEVLVYTGADGSFTLYEDEGDGYGYESGAFSTIEFSLKDGVLSIGRRSGSFPGMLTSRSFLVRFITPDGSFERCVRYDGRPVKVS